MIENSEVIMMMVNECLKLSGAVQKIGRAPKGAGTFRNLLNDPTAPRRKRYQNKQGRAPRAQGEQGHLEIF